MKMFTLRPYLTVALLFLATKGLTQADVLMQHNDMSRTGWNPNETILNTTNVTPTSFGLLYRKSVDDQTLAQPLIVSGVQVTDPITHTLVTRNLLIVVTVSNTMYAFDADDGTLDPYWTRNFTPAGTIPPNATDVHSNLCGWSYTDFQAVPGLGQAASYGTVGTPVIDKTTHTIYFVSRYRNLDVDNVGHGVDEHDFDWDWSSAGYFQQVHALDIATGTDKFGSPVLIDPATTFVMGTSPDANANHEIHFDPRRENQRPGLFISNGIVYIPYASSCDMDYYHGWILGYKIDDLTQQLIRYVTTPNDQRGGIWMAGAAPAVDAAGNIFFAAGNGNNSSTANSPDNMALSVVKVTPDLANHTLKNISWYKPVPATYDAWNVSDLDMGTGVLLVPGTNMLVTHHKNGRIFIGPQNIPPPGGAYNETNPNVHWFDLGVAANGQAHSSVSYFGGSNKQYVYQSSEYTHIMAFPVNAATNTLGDPIVNTSVPVIPIKQGGYSSVSSNGTDPETGILWVTQLTPGSPAGSGLGTMYALKADDITQPLWNSDNDPADKLGNYAKMSPPTIANGKVYVTTFTNKLNVYGLLANNTRCVNNIALNKTYNDLPGHAGAGFTPNLAFDNNNQTRWAMNGAAPQYLVVDLGARYDVCKTSIRWNQGEGGFTDYARDFIIGISDDNITWTNLDSIVNNAFTENPAINEYNEHTTGRYVRVAIKRGGVAGTSISEFQVYGTLANSCVSPALANMSVTNITRNTATLNFKPVTGVTNYIVKYKPSFSASYVTRNIQDLSGSGNTLSVDIIGLTCKFGYDFLVQSDCGSGKLSTPNTITFTTLDCSSPCLNLTRWGNLDLGDVQVSGSTCYTGVTETEKTWTLTGSGSGMGGNGDIFQFNSTDQNTDDDFIAQVTSQDALPAANQAGIMMRDILSDVARFIFIGKTGDNRLMLAYRSVEGGPATVSYIPNPNNASFFKLSKSGTNYTAYYGLSNLGPWTQMGAASMNLGFGATGIKAGMAVASTNATSTSAATFLISSDATTLPAEIINFKAVNFQNEYVSVTWQTNLEIHNDHFDIERSTDGVKFEKIGTVKAVGNSGPTQSYSFMDEHAAKGINFYRLKQVDSDGRFNYSSIEKVKFGAGAAPVIYPNPVKSVFTAVSGSELISEIVVYNAQGRSVYFAIGNTTDADMKVNISFLPKGIYFLKVKTNSKIYQFKILKE